MRGLLAFHADANLKRAINLGRTGDQALAADGLLQTNAEKQEKDGGQFDVAHQGALAGLNKATHPTFPG
jgi:hypothetical protein